MWFQETSSLSLILQGPLEHDLSLSVFGLRHGVGLVYHSERQSRVADHPPQRQVALTFGFCGRGSAHWLREGTHRQRQL